MLPVPPLALKVIVNVVGITAESFHRALISVFPSTT